MLENFEVNCETLNELETVGSESSHYSSEGFFEYAEDCSSTCQHNCDRECANNCRLCCTGSTA